MTTHIGLEAIVFWTFIGQTERDRFKDSKFLFWLVVAFSIVPDMDIFFAIHRGPSHSVVIPSFMVFTGLIIHFLFNSSIVNRILPFKAFSNPESKNLAQIKSYYAFIGRCVMYGGLFWIMHLFLDWDVPLALFYPFSDRLYVGSFTIVIDLIPWFIFPVGIAGAFFKFTGIPFLQGLKLQLFNLPPEDRIAAFGSETINITIWDFWIHIFIFAVFIVYVAVPNLPKLKKPAISAIIHQIDWSVLAGGFTILLIGTFMGPAIGSQIIDSQDIATTLQVSEWAFSPAVAVNFEPTNFLFEPAITQHVSVFLNITSLKIFTAGLLITPASEYNKFVQNIGELYDNHNVSDPQNATEFNNKYKQAQSALVATAIAKNNSDLPQLSLNLNVSTNMGSNSIIFVISDWNMTAFLNQEDLIQSVNLQVSIITPRSSIYAIGWLFILSGVVIMIVAIFKEALTEKLTRKKAENELNR
ncbi:MAG: metal-dependent hydrolase [Promethearchaeota archaeon]